jgi:hypothetical protein
MNVDITSILDEWPYEPNRVSARRIRGRDGRDKIQLRLDLGLLQMDCQGRPDGHRPNGCESILEFFEKRLRDWRTEHGDDAGFCLDESDCQQLRSEAVMYYHRYLAEFVLEEYDNVARDTRRNLRAMDLCWHYAQSEVDREAMEQYRPYVIMMHTRARALKAWQDGRIRGALAVIRRGLRNLTALQEDPADPLPEEDSSEEVQVLQAMEKELQQRLPVDPVEQLRQQLNRAVREERYEDAADLRDRLNRHHGGRD